MKSVHGFTIIELLIALACTVLTLSALTGLTMRLYTAWQAAAIVTQSSCEMHAAIDVVRNELQRAPRVRSAWKIVGLHELLWRASSLDKALRIVLIGDRLERCEGSYDERSKIFHASSSSVLAHGVRLVRFTEHHKMSQAYDAIAVKLLMIDGKEGEWLLRIG